MENINNKIEKPTIIAMAEGREALINTINRMTLPMFLIAPIVKDIYNDISLQANNELEYTKIEYEKALKEANKESTEK